MPTFGSKSQGKLDTCHPNLQAVLNQAIKVYNFSIIYGHRGKALQNKIFAEKKSKVEYPNSKHNDSPSLAVDLAPYDKGIDWNDKEAFIYLAGIIKGIAFGMGVNIRWGGDWDGDNDLHDQTFNDLGHFELVF